MHVTLNHRCVILMNDNVYRMMGKPRAAVMLFNRRDSVIGLSPAHPEIEDAFPIRHKLGNWVIFASSFCQHYGIKVEKTQAFVNPDLDKNGVLRLDLTRMVRRGRGGWPEMYSG